MADLFRILDCVEQVYGAAAAPGIMAQLQRVVRRHQARLPRRTLTERDAVLIAYPDQVSEPGKPPLATLDGFARQYLQGLVTGLHVLPFLPSSSDDGFSVVQHRTVDPAYGDWDDISRLAQQFDLMFDVVANHSSVQGEWFRAFQRDEEPFRDYFKCVGGHPDLSAVVRPRTSPVLTTFPTARGEKSVWTTFSADQADLDYQNPAVLLEMLDILLFYVEHGAAYLRLDAIAYIWKEIGTACIHLPQVHAIVRLIRGILDETAPHVMLLTETNVSHGENLSYLGDGTNEAQMVYNFALPALVLHAFYTMQATTISDWAANMTLPPNGTAFFNILATHDGIGLNGVRGILGEAELQALVRHIDARGGLISHGSNPDGTLSPYEINANYCDALDMSGPRIDAGLRVARFLTAHAIMLAFRGMPGIYFHSLFGSHGWHEGVTRTGRARSINREKLRSVDLIEDLAEPASFRSLVYQGLRRLLGARAGTPVFSPHAEQRITRVASGVFAFSRGSALDSERVLCVHNITPIEQSFPCSVYAPEGSSAQQVDDLISSAQFDWNPHGSLSLGPYQSMWLRMKM